MIACAAYRSGEKLHSEYYGEDADYTRKGGVILTEILLPPHAPAEYADRETLWNAVENTERHPKAQLAYSFDIALQNEFSLEENIALARQFLLDEFVSRGMIVDFAIHDPDKKGGIPNPHVHFLCPIRPLKENGEWDAKQHREYVLDEHGGVSVMTRAMMCSTLFPPPTGAGRRRWNTGGKRGRNCATLNLPRKVWTAASTTAAMNDKVWNNFPPSMRGQPSDRWRPRASAPTRAI